MCYYDPPKIITCLEEKQYLTDEELDLYLKRHCEELHAHHVVGDLAQTIDEMAEYDENRAWYSRKDVDLLIRNYKRYRIIAACELPR